MDIFMAVLMLLALIGISNVVNRMIPFVPVPLIQIALGSLLAVAPLGLHLPLEPELFFVLFIAPLLYNDGKHTPRDELWRLRAPILLLAVGLVFVTVFVVGYAIHWLIPSIPLPAAFGLAAILSPTDAVAVSSLAGRIHLPRSLKRLLEGEALMNDASGLVAFKFAIAAAVTGVFSLPQASWSFVLISVGGLLIGAVLALLITSLRALLRRFGMEDETMHMLLQILTPFILYLIAEELGMSGILAAVAGGIVHAIESDRWGMATPKLQAMSTNTWSVILFVLNGLVFVILGLQIPDVSRTILSDPHFNNIEVLGYAAAIFAMLMALRFLWSLVFTRGGRLFGRERRERTSLKILLMASISGVRGAVTLAGAFSIPLVLEGGGLFPERNLIIFLAAAVILMSLLTASVFLPMLSRRKQTGGEAEKLRVQRKVQVQVMEAAVNAVYRQSEPENEGAVSAVVDDYKRWMQQIDTNHAARDTRRRGFRGYCEKETGLRLMALGAERDCVRGLLDKGEINREMASQFAYTLDQIELVLANRVHVWIVFVKALWHRLRANFGKGPLQAMSKMSGSDFDRLRKVKIESCNAAIAVLTRQCCQDNETETNRLVMHYKNIVERLQRFVPGDSRRTERFDEQKKELHGVAIQAERNEVQSLYEKGAITRDLAGELRRMIGLREAQMLEQGELA
ncbi:Na+/H+ antiporter [Paenibacillus athensensis]|uniref:Na+/H+ antiporter n=1 Tax=Paenibacillus athensensis TaxID=1967502 RepID=A0A4Y8PQL2_9BACL|nr:Na+/H+ antiporter [Paenibacillus athensensis]MCD1259274.1 Na+/H+ antiporter [Paenibacillus athensensis]